MNTRDLDTYNREVTYFQTQGILELTKSPSTRSALAKRKGQPRKKIPRFKVKDPREQIRQIKDRDTLKKIAVFGLPLDITQKRSAIDLFGVYGYVEDVEVPMPRYDFRTMFAFVTFSNSSTTLDLVSGNQMLVMRGYPLTIKIHRISI